MADTIDIDPPPPPPAEVVTATAIPVDAPPPEQGCMSKRSGLEKCLIILVIIVLIIVLAAVIAFVVYYYFASPPEGTCLEDNCVKAASRLKKNMDESASACDDFYRYACGGWLKDRVLEPGETSVDFKTAIQDTRRIQLKSILEQKIKRDDPEYSKKPRTFYMGCMDIGKRNDRGVKPFLEIIQDVGKFPAIDSTWNETDFDMEDMIIKLHRQESQPLFQVYIGREKNGKKRLYIAPKPTKFIQKMEKDPEKMKMYKSATAQALTLLGADAMSAEGDAEDMIDFEISLAKIVTKEEDKSEFLEKEAGMEISELKRDYPLLNWLQLFRGLVENPDGGVQKKIENDETVKMMDKDYFKELTTLLEKTPQRVLANYMMSQLLQFTFHLNGDFRNLMESLRKLDGIKSKPLWEDCVELSTDTFGLLVSRLYIDKYFNKDARKYMTSMVDDLKKSFLKRMQNGWLSEKAFDKAKFKLDEMATKVGFPDLIHNDDELDKMYKGISSNEKTFIENVISGAKYQSYAKMENLWEEKDKDWWFVLPTAMDANNDLERNEIVFPAAFLQEPIYSPEYSSSMNYGSVGALIGHDMTHGFDKKGSGYNEDGAKKTWWTVQDTDSFEANTDCFIRQYGCYKWDSLSMRGENTLNENVADDGGLKISYAAYRSLIERRGSEEPRLPGLDLDHKQIFFLSFAQMWCAKYSDEAKQATIDDSSHAPNPYRVYGPLENSNAFAEVYNCPVGSRMNPMKKCTMW